MNGVSTYSLVSRSFSGRGTASVTVSAAEDAAEDGTRLLSRLLLKFVMFLVSVEMIGVPPLVG